MAKEEECKIRISGDHAFRPANFGEPRRDVIPHLV